MPQSPAPLARPAALEPRGRIGVLAPASAPYDPERLPRGIRRLIDAGFDVIGPRNPLEPDGYLAASDDARLAELNGWLRRTDAQVLWCVRGGYGSLRLLDRIDYEAARAHAKLLIGYSDITALHLALYRKAGWTGLSGPMLGVEWGTLDPGLADETLEWARGGVPESPLSNETLTTLVPGTAEGTLIGGNLSMIVRLVGTPFLPDLSGAILFLEDVGEPPYRIDGLLAQLRLSGHLEHLAGVLLGGFTESEPRPDRPSRSLQQVFEDYFGSAPYPVVTGLAYGHFPEKRAMPVGVRGRIEATGDAATFRVLEPVTL